jgi:hypothetical protein
MSGARSWSVRRGERDRLHRLILVGDDTPTGTARDVTAAYPWISTMDAQIAVLD